MPLPDPTSRYARSAVIVVPGPDGSARSMLAPRVIPEPPKGGSFQVPPGARLDLLGAGALGDSTRWWLIADANAFLDPAELERPGRVIDLPHG